MAARVAGFFVKLVPLQTTTTVMPPIDQDLLRRWLQRIATAKDDPNEWETGHVELQLGNGEVVVGEVAEFVGDVVSIDCHDSVTEVVIEEIVDLKLDLQSPGPE